MMVRPQPGAVQQLTDETMPLIECLEQRSHFAARKHDGYVNALLRATYLVQPRQLDGQDFLVQVEDCGQRLPVS